VSGVRTFDVADLTGEALMGAKRGRTISLCIPCRNEATTIGPIVEAARTALIDDCQLLDELIVLDDRSVDTTARVAAGAGATVISIDEVHAEHGAGSGKGNALWATLLVSTGDVVVWCDGDLTTFSPDWIVKLVAPLLLDDTVAMVKPIYDRPTDEGGGGRTTELVARPLLRLYARELAALAQPLAGEYAVRRSVIEQIPMVQGWGAEIAMVLDVSERHGSSSVAQVSLGVRRHRHQTLAELSTQATEVMAAAIERLDVRARSDLRVSPQAVRPPTASLARPHSHARR
jgi:glucosyl-3-phosphoglycerate synthase